MPGEKHSASVYKWRLLPNFWLNNRLSPQEASVATLCRVLHRQRLDLFTIISPLRKFAECSYCDVSLPPILPVLSRFIESSVIYSLYSRTNYIHAFIQSYIRTFIHSHIHTQHMHNINSYMVASVTQSFVWSYPFVSVLSRFKLLVLNNGPLEFTFLSCFKPPVLNNGPLEFPFLSCFKPPVLNNGPLESTFCLISGC
jgi:hypothetical protein